MQIELWTWALYLLYSYYVLVYVLCVCVLLSCLSLHLPLLITYCYLWWKSVCNSAATLLKHLFSHHFGIMNATKGMYVWSFAPKIDLLRAWLTYNKPHAITLSETWLNSNISDDEVMIENYVLYRKDGIKRKGPFDICILKLDCRTYFTNCESPAFWMPFC